MDELRHKFAGFFQLMRLHQPTGIWLLLWPCWWSIAMASEGMADMHLLALFALGAVIMRGAGCTVNDIVDRKIDKQVARTRTRPLASGALSLGEAGVFLLVLLSVALLIVSQLRMEVLLLSVAALPLVVAYPFMKRITWWPQLFLGLTFNWGALMGWVAVTGSVELPALLLYLGGVCWTLGYDTIYAHQDKEDDELIGVKSTALRLGQQSRVWIALFYLVAVLSFSAAGMITGEGLLFVMGMLLMSLHFIWQIVSVDFEVPQICMRVFRSNGHIGWIVFLPLLLR